MIFTSTVFLLRFLPAILAFNWAAEALRLRQARWLGLLVGSLVFYAFWRADHLPVLLGSIGGNYWLGLRIAGSGGQRRQWLLRAGVAGNLLLLCGYKYTGFLAENAAWLTGHGGALPAIALPLGISFFTFTQIAYLVDCANDRRGEHGLVEYALFVTFFPHLLAGPIIHHSEMIPQFQSPRRTWDDAVADAAEGLALLAVGAAKKVLLADPLSPLADAAFGQAAQGSVEPGLALAGALAYTFQLYFDFSGYSDMALGLARMFGVRFPANFDSPYKAASIVEFWRRWHMTLSRWLRDYLYIPLGGNRGGPWRTQANLLLTMLLGGLWHGAHWNFVLWGGMHGVALVAAHFVGRHAGWPFSGRRALGWALTFAFVVVAWVFFRATTTPAALAMLSAMLAGVQAPGGAAAAFAGAHGALLAVAAAVAFLAPNSNAIVAALATRQPIGLAAGALAGAAGVAAVLAGIAAPASSPFLYFNF